MPELGPLGSVRGALRNERPYRDRFERRVAVLERSLVVLFEQDSAVEPLDGRPVGEDAKQRRLGDRIEIEIIGITDEDLPAGTVRRWADGRLAHSYPGFVDWLMANNDWDIGLAPLRDTPFNRCKSGIKTLDYAALGLCTLASAGAAYGGSLADGVGGLLCDNTPDSWFDALETVIRNPVLRTELQAAGHARLRERHLLESQRADRVAILSSVLA